MGLGGTLLAAKCTLWSLSHILLRVNASDSSVCSLTAGFNWHSHTVIQCHPIEARRRCSSMSRARLRAIFAFQNSVLLLGTT